MWKKLYEYNQPWYLSIWRSTTWKVYGLLRKLKAGPCGVVEWWKMNQRCKALNRQLLAEAESIRHEPKYPAPTPGEIEGFIVWAEENYGIEIK